MSKTNYFIALVSLSIISSAVHGSDLGPYESTVDTPAKRAAFAQDMKRYQDSNQYKKDEARQQKEIEEAGRSLATQSFVRSALSGQEEQDPKTIRKRLIELSESACHYQQQQVDDTKKDVTSIDNQANSFCRFLRTDGCIALISSMQKFLLQKDSKPQEEAPVRITNV